MVIMETFPLPINADEHALLHFYGVEGFRKHES